MSTRIKESKLVIKLLKELSSSNSTAGKLLSNISFKVSGKNKSETTSNFLSGKVLKEHLGLLLQVLLVSYVFLS